MQKFMLWLTGEYCEVVLDQPCPTNWWGYPVCGPCHCDVDKGYDGDCNKTSGECRCEVSYFNVVSFYFIVSNFA